MVGEAGSETVDASCCSSVLIPAYGNWLGILEDGSVGGLADRWIPRSLTGGPLTQRVGSTDSEVIRLFFLGDVLGGTPKSVLIATLEEDLVRVVGLVEEGEVVVVVVVEVLDRSEVIEPEDDNGTAVSGSIGMVGLDFGLGFLETWFVDLKEN